MNLSPLAPRSCVCESGSVPADQGPWPKLATCSACKGTGEVHPDPSEELSITRQELADIQKYLVKAARLATDIQGTPETKFNGVDPVLWATRSPQEKAEWFRVWGLVTQLQFACAEGNLVVDYVVRESEKHT